MWFGRQGGESDRFGKLRNRKVVGLLPLGKLKGHGSSPAVLAIIQLQAQGGIISGFWTPTCEW